MIVHNIAHSISSKPNRLQVAKDGKWEECWIIDLDKLPTTAEVTNYLATTSFQTVAVESLFEQHDGVYILGLNFNPHLKVKSPHEFISSIIDITCQYDQFEKYLTDLDSLLVGKNYLLEHDPDVIRIGVVNYWFSLGPIAIWQKGYPKEISLAMLEERLATNPKTSETCLNYQAMSFVCNLEEVTPGLYHWMKSPCAKEEGGIWKIDREKTLYFLHEWGGLEIKR